jgi:hypothetical protein
MRLSWDDGAEAYTMTDWIDRFAASQNEQDQRKHTQYQHDLLRELQIRANGPTFFASIVKAIHGQADELNQKLGGAYKGITSSSKSSGETVTEVTVETGDKRVKVGCRLNLDARKFVSDTHRQGAHEVFGNSDRKRDFNLQVNTESADVWAVSDDAIYKDPTEIATLLLKEAFGRD